MSGPSAIEKPRSAKMAVNSSVTWEIGCRRPAPIPVSRTGKVTSSVSARSRASSAASLSVARRVASASVTRSLSTLTAAPAVLRSSGAILPSVDSSAEIEPFLPSAPTRTASSAPSSPAAAMAAMVSVSRLAMSVMSGFRAQRGSRGFCHAGGGLSRRATASPRAARRPPLPQALTTPGSGCFFSPLRRRRRRACRRHRGIPCSSRPCRAPPSRCRPSPEPPSAGLA